MPYLFVHQDCKTPSSLGCSMARYYFHIREGDQIIEDLEGIDLPDIAAVQEEALQAAREMVADLVVQGQPIDEKRFVVVDENGEVVGVVPFRVTLLDSGGADQ